MRLARIEGTVRASLIAVIALLAFAIGVLGPVATVAAAVGDTPALVSAASRKVHGAAGTFDLALALTPANPTTEPRQGPGQTVVFIFDKTVTAGNAAVTEGTATLGTVTFSGSEMIVALTGVTNLQYVTVAVASVVAADGGTGGSGAVRIGYLAGDVSQNRVVALSDLGQVNAQVAQFVTAANFLKDINASGTLSLADKGITNSHVTKALAAVPAPANQPPQINAGTNQAVTLPASANLSGSGNDDGLPGPPLTFTWTKVAGPGTVIFGTPNAAATSATFSTDGIYVLRLTTSDGVLSNGDDVSVTVNASGELPPDPATVAPPPDRSVATSLRTSTAFLYTGANPIQTGVASGTIEARRAAVLRGTVHTSDGAALSGVTITILAHPEFGQTLSRADGTFDLAVNGGGLLTVNYRKTGLLPVQRQANAPWQDYAVLPDVVMIALDVQVTPINLNAAAMQVARGSAMSDADGTRRATLLIPQGTTANLVMPDGSTQPIGALNVRATEYTAGPNGPRAMPAVLPPASGYTYAVELSADEAIAAGAASVNFNPPLVNYVENFLGFPVGTVVPAGFYDRVKAAWLPSENGRVIKIVGVNAGFATVDSVGSRSLPPLALTSEERQQLATLYPVGQELWRVPIPHFSPSDLNWPFAPPPDATLPNQPRPKSDETVDQCVVEVSGSIIECENQILGESIAIAGTSFTLNYRSVRAPGRIAGNTLQIPLSSSIPASLKRIELTVDVAGRTFRQSFAPTPNQRTAFVWDGLDAYARPLQGRQPITGSIGYVYDGVYMEGAVAAAFARFGTAAVGFNRTRQEVTLSQAFQARIGVLDARPAGIGGWTLSPHHIYDPLAQQLHLGDGRRRGSEGIGAVIRNVDLRNPNGTPAPSLNKSAVAVGPEGSVYVVGPTGPGENVMRRILPDGPTVPFGSIENVSTVYELAVAPDGSVYVTQEFVNSEHGNRISRIAPDGTTTIVAGKADAIGFSGDGGPANLATFDRPQDVAVAADGTLYIVDNGNKRIRRIGPDGIITTVAGTGVVCPTSGSFLPCDDGGPATQARLDQPLSVAVSPDGSIYLFEFGTRRIRRVGPGGIITTFAGNGSACGQKVPLPCGDGGPATQAALDAGGLSKLAVGPDGSLYIAEQGGNRVRQIGSDGIIRTVAGRGGFVAVPFVDGMPATQAQLSLNDSGSADVAVAPDGTLYIAGGSTLRRVIRPFPDLSASDFAVAQEGGRQLFIFDSTGRHLRTLDALTGATVHEFTYDAAGRLAQVIEKTGGTDNVTIIEHDAAGNPTAIVAPFGQRTTLGIDANGFLASIANPAGESIQFASTSGGLLTSLTDPRGKTTTFAYEPDGRLRRDTDAAGGFQNLARTEVSDGFTVARATALSRITTYKVESLPAGIQRRSLTVPDGTQAVRRESPDAGTATATASDGTVTSVQLGPDPRFGMQSPVATVLSVALPTGLTVTTANAQTAVLSDALNPLSLVSLTGTSTVAGRTSTSIYTAATRTEVTTTAAGRTGTLTIDSLARPVQMQAGGLATAVLAYDGRGRLASMTRGTGVDARTNVFTYDAQGFLGSITDPVGQTVQFTYDTAGRLISKTLPGGRVILHAYDAAGNLTSVTPPGRPPHTFDYSNRSERTLTTPPAVPGTGPSSLAFNLDRQMTTTTWPDDRTVALGYDASGRPSVRVFASSGVTTGADTFAYDAAGRVASVAAAGGVTSSFGYAGPLVTSETWSGAIAGSVSASHDNSFRLLSQSVNGTNPIPYGYESDSLLVSAGLLSFTRDPQHGLVTGSALGAVNTTIGYNAFGEFTSYAVTASSSPLYNANVTRDKLGRIVDKAETLGGVTDTYVYSYDTAGQVATVARNGVSVETYAYDSNGNRTGATIGGAGAVALYDAQDRLTTYGTTSYGYTAAGELLSKTTSGQTTTYEYDAVGNLLAVGLPDGTSISYVIDGLDRRVGRRVNGTLVQGFLYGDTRRPVAELDGTGALLSRFIYTGQNAPAYMIKGGIAHRIISDRVGSVRMVVHASTGAIAQRMDYDTFGNVVVDTNPGFQPFGFAGGIYDGATGLVRFGARDYDAQVGRWTAKDPIGFGGGDTSLYRYVRNDPVNLADPSGLDNWDTVAGFFDQLHQDTMLANPIIALQVLVEAGVRAAFEEMGWDPGTPQWYNIVRPPPPPWVDSMSADYTKGELIAQCVEIVLAAADSLAAGVGSAAGALEARLNRSAATLAVDDLGRDVAARAAAREAARRALPKVEVIKSEFGAGTVNRGRNAASGFTGR